MGAKNIGSNGFSNSAVYDDVFDGQMELDDSNENTGNGETVGSTGNSALILNDLLGQTLRYGQEIKSEFSGDPKLEVKRALEDTFALMAYSDPRQSPLAYMLDPNERTPVAEELNSAILGMSILILAPPMAPLANPLRSEFGQVFQCRTRAPGPTDGSAH